MTTKVIPFKKSEIRLNDFKKGKALYSLYREERIKQGFEEFKWESLMISHHLVWERLAEKIKFEV